MNKGWVLAALACAGLAATAAPWWQARLQTQALRSQGLALYLGQAPLPAQLRGHEEALPGHAARCSNCHEGAQPIGPRLDAAWLAQPQARRGGPPSRYDAASLCRLLREGIDPAKVLVSRAMPRYTLTDSDCAALWAHLLSR